VHAYAIASNLSAKNPAAPLATAPSMTACSKRSWQMFQRGEFNRIRLANKAIAKL